jgi:uncharacterized repeat protein (TIGR03837 family)
MTARWDIFCKVIDNLGDAGVSWRLARQLAHEHALAVTLWIDDPAALARFVPGIEPSLDRQRAAGVDVRRWGEPFPTVPPAEVVVEAFGCSLPEDYMAAMARAEPAPAWFVLEYLSAEAWIDDSHALGSPHPRLPLVRRFWFPGFTPKSGGLLRERDLIAARDAFRRDRDAENAVWSAIGVPSPWPGEWRVSLFCYPNPALPALLDTLADGDRSVTCVVPEGIATGALDAWTAGNVPHRGHPFARGRLTLHAIPFLAQDDYDRLLWASHVNFVRGEDSFVRAQWAARPFVWHIYPQAEGAHEQKLAAFVERFSAGLDSSSAAALARLHRAWNGIPGAGPIADAWGEFAAARPQLECHGVAWSGQLAGHSDLASGLVRAASGRV